MMWTRLANAHRFLALGIPVAVFAFWHVELPGTAGVNPAARRATIDFNRDIRPIFSENCFQCHGPDEKQRKADLRFDLKESALGHATAIVPGKADESALIERVSAAEASRRMPPAKTDKRLKPEQIDLLRRWIDEGAKWSDHWAFIKPERPPLPKFSREPQASGSPRNSIDYFILARLETERLHLAPEADKITLIRRVTLDLTGLPPTPAEVDAFLADNSPDAYEKLVDRLLASPRYGERMALEWLDAARFADTHGYHIDSGRDMTRWRDWVINAFNQNMPFDRFTIEQMAGDLLPNATLQQKIASGFNRNHMINFEGGAIPEEYHTAYIVDRVNTTGTVWLGLTVGCAQCHDHKYDPITQKEYYQLYAFFNNVPENGLDGQKGNAVPFLKIPTPEQQKKLDQLAASIKQVEQKLNGPSELDAAQAEWEKAAAAEKGVEWTVLDSATFRSAGGARMAKRPDKSIRVTGHNPATDTYSLSGLTPLKEVTAFRVEVLPDERPGGGAKLGRSENGNFVLTEVTAGATVADAPATNRPLALKAATADFSQKDFPIAHALDQDSRTGWAIYPEVEKPHAAVFEFREPVRLGEREHLSLSFAFESQFTQHQFAKFRVSVTNAKDPHEKTALPANIRAMLATPADKRTDSQKTELRTYYRTNISPEGKRLQHQLATLRKERDELDKGIPTTMVMQELERPRDTFMLIRGQYDKKGEKIGAGVPAFLPALVKRTPGANTPGSPNRLDLAKWLVDPANPLTARVIVNRYWQMYFGTGLVKTAEDFGSQGEWPSHPELLDWLATEFIRTGWNVKSMQRLMVTSAIYRQSSKVTPALLSKDPENRLLGRQSRVRLQAEFIRDQALAVSGLLNGEIGGHSVSPYQPPGIWEELASRQDGKNWTAQEYKQSKGKDLYRRTMYTFWKRTAPPPTLVTFDAPDRETCTVRRARTNTPLQALVLMNDPTYVEASRKLAERIMTEGGPSPEDRITFTFRLLTARRPNPEEVAVLRKVFDAQLAVFRRDGKAALKLLSVGESPRNEKLDVAELAAWTMVASAILNLDEAVMRS